MLFQLLANSICLRSHGFTAVTNGVDIQTSPEAASVPPLALVLIPSLLKQDSPINKLLYARDIPRYKQMVERWVQIELKLLKTSSKTAAWTT